MTLAPRWRTLVRIAGWTLLAASTIFLAVVARQHWDAISAMALSPAQWLVLAGLAIGYGVSLLLVAAGWHWVLALAGAGSPGRAHSMRAHATAQLAKYVPGNVFHLVGRHLIHRQAGMDDVRLAKAALAEIVLLLAAAVTIVAACLLAAMPEALRAWAWLAFPALGMAVCGAVVAMWWLCGGALRDALSAWLAYVIFFAVMGSIVAVIVAMLGGALLPGVAGGGVAAWIAGFVTPGAPGGLGVREAAMVLIGGEGTSRETLVVAAALLRLVTFAGDLVCFALGNLLFRDGAAPSACTS